MKMRFSLKLVGCSVILLSVLFFSSCLSVKMRNYYEDTSNYITVTGTVTHIAYSDQKDALYYGFSDVIYPSDLSYKFEWYGFIISGKNFQIVCENDIEEKIKEGDIVTFTAAPRYFYDGYAIPIVAISVNGETLLDFEDGYVNLLQWLAD